LLSFAPPPPPRILACIGKEEKEVEIVCVCNLPMYLFASEPL